MSRLQKDSVWNYSSVGSAYAAPLPTYDENSLGVPCNETEDLDSQSNHSHFSFCEGTNKPIVVGYAFGPKKMSTMGVVLAEASRVKVIQEELKEDQYDEEEEQDDVGLFCEEEDPSLLTSAALRGLEESKSTLKSTIITLGNSNNTDLQHIVRYFRSSCSSAAASASIASVGETTVSTPTTTNSCPTYNSYKTRRSGRSERNRFPAQISFVPLDLDQPLDEQHGGKFDLILHKLTEDILSCSLTQDSGCGNADEQWQQEILDGDATDPSLRRVRAIRDYCHLRNPNCCLVDDPKHVQTLMSRSEIANVLQKCLKGVKTSSGINVKTPRFVVVPEVCQGSDNENPQQHCQTQGLVQALQEENQGDGPRLSTPLIVKPLIAAGTKQSHYMLIALKESGLAKVPPKSIVQEFVNHDATLYKVYVLGDFVNVYRRNSLPNLPSDTSEATIDLVEFDSQRPYPKLKDFGMDDTSDSDTTDPVRTAPLVTSDEVKPIVQALKKAFGLELFGFDILMGSNNGDCFVVDVNYFPSYKEVPNFPSLLARYLTQRVLEQRRRGIPNESNETSCDANATTSAKEGALIR